MQVLSIKIVARQKSLLINCIYRKIFLRKRIRIINDWDSIRLHIHETVGVLGVAIFTETKRTVEVCVRQDDITYHMSTDTASEIDSLTHDRKIGYTPFLSRKMRPPSHMWEEITFFIHEDINWNWRINLGRTRLMLRLIGLF